MKRLFFLSVIFAVSACGIKEQADQLQALKNCTYEVTSADSVYLANVEVAKLVSKDGFELLSVPQLAIAYMQKRMPFKGVVQLKITNPGNKEAAVNQFDYKIFIKTTELTSGSIDNKISVASGGGSTIVPIRIDQDIYSLLSKAENQKAVTDFFGSQEEKNAVITIKIKPTIAIGKELIRYPDYISIDKKISNKTLLSYLDNLR